MNHATTPTHLHRLILAALPPALLLMQGCQPGHSTRVDAPGSGPGIHAVKFLADPQDQAAADDFSFMESQTSSRSPASATLTPEATVVWTSGPVRLDNAQQVYSARSQNGSLSYSAIVGSVRLPQASPPVNREFQGTINPPPAPGELSEITLDSGWAYVQKGPGFSGGVFRPIVRTRRAVAMSDGTRSLLVFNDSPPNPATPGTITGVDEYVFNRARNGAGNVILTRTDNNAQITIPPGQYVRIFEQGGTLVYDTPRDISSIPAGSKARRFLNYQRNVRELVGLPDAVDE